MRRAGPDIRLWLLWGVAASLPSLMGRNPFPIIACLIIALTVRATTPGDQDWGALLKLATVFAAVGVVFNLFTYHGGDREVASLPGWIPIVGGPLTLNAMVYGVLSGLALVTLVVVWSTVAQRLIWGDLVRITPPSLAQLMVAGAVAMALIPRTVDAYREIREAQALRGYRPRGARDLAPLVAPLLTQGLEHAVTLSEALESRGFGGPPSGSDQRLRFSLGLTGAITGVAAGAFLLSTGGDFAGLFLLLISLGLFLILLRSNAGKQTFRPTRYRDLRFTRSDWLLLCPFVIAILAVLTISSLEPAAVRYEPYPVIIWPTVNLPLIAALSLLMIPAVVVQTPETDG